MKVAGNPREGLAIEVATDDLLAGGKWDGAGHGWTSGFIERENQIYYQYI